MAMSLDLIPQSDAFFHTQYPLVKDSLYLAETENIVKTHINLFHHSLHIKVFL